ncbi:unnamed protein product [Linum tenue]|uniref:Uncharacterized protein n=1 Tax=Linum tenue TaxID=586396 RepID=A0AAV0J566_9ROSI|nr:unnamed protein product [Linum tenue]CAI0404809.1 unnamed protein product [Linum tenue]
MVSSKNSTMVGWWKLVVAVAVMAVFIALLLPPATASRVLPEIGVVKIDFRKVRGDSPHGGGYQYDP